MRKLLYKEILLCTHVDTVIYIVLALLIMIPNWPPVVAFIYPLSGIMTFFARCLANKDIEYTVLLPIKKTDIVKGKTLYLSLVELAVILVGTIGGVVRYFVFTSSSGAEDAYFNAVRPTLSLLGFVFLAFGIMNLILISIYYKNPFKKLSGPFMISLFVSMLILALGTIVTALVPVLRGTDTTGLIAQISTLAGGIILFILSTFLGYRIGAKAFEKIDL